jgi:hypothetical protein
MSPCNEVRTTAEIIRQIALTRCRRSKILYYGNDEFGKAGLGNASVSVATSWCKIRLSQPRSMASS